MSITARAVSGDELDRVRELSKLDDIAELHSKFFQWSYTEENCDTDTTLGRLRSTEREKLK